MLRWDLKMMCLYVSSKTSLLHWMCWVSSGKPPLKWRKKQGHKVRVVFGRCWGTKGSQLVNLDRLQKDRAINLDNLVGEINSARHVVSAPVQRGLDLEPQAAIIYASIAKQNQVNLFPSGLVMNPWLGCTPDPQSVWFECWGARPFSFWPFGEKGC